MDTHSRRSRIGGLLGGLAVVAVLLLGRAGRAEACWIPLGPYAGSIGSLALNPQTPTTLYAGNDGGVFKSTDGGASWNPVNTGLTNLDVRALALDPRTLTTLYAGTEGGGVFKWMLSPP